MGKNIVDIVLTDDLHYSAKPLSKEENDIVNFFGEKATDVETGGYWGDYGHHEAFAIGNLVYHGWCVLISSGCSCGSTPEVYAGLASREAAIEKLDKWTLDRYPLSPGFEVEERDF